MVKKHHKCMMHGIDFVQTNQKVNLIVLVTKMHFPCTSISANERARFSTIIMETLWERNLIVRVSLVLRRTVVGCGDWRFDNRSASHYQGQVESCRYNIFALHYYEYILTNFYRCLCVRLFTFILDHKDGRAMCLIINAKIFALQNLQCRRIDEARWIWTSLPANVWSITHRCHYGYLFFFGKLEM